jgi:hypothetical protein
MASAQASGSAVPQLMATVKQLTPDELREFKRRFAEWQDNGGQADEETALIQACHVRLPEEDEHRLKKLIAKSERGALRPNELADYRALVRRAEKLDVTRLAALTQLARRWGKPVRVVMQAIGWEGGEDDTTSHPTRPSKTGARPRR